MLQTGEAVGAVEAAPLLWAAILGMLRELFPLGMREKLGWGSSERWRCAAVGEPVGTRAVSSPRTPPPPGLPRSGQHGPLTAAAQRGL